MPAFFEDVAPVAIDAATLGPNTLVPGVTGKRIQVINIMLMATDPVLIQFYTGSVSAPNALSGPMRLVVARGFSVGLGIWLVTAVGDDLIVDLDAANRVGGSLTYMEIA